MFLIWLVRNFINFPVVVLCWVAHLHSHRYFILHRSASHFCFNLCDEKNVRRALELKGGLRLRKFRDGELFLFLVLPSLSLFCRLGRLPKEMKARLKQESRGKGVFVRLTAKPAGRRRY